MVNKLSFLAFFSMLGFSILVMLSSANIVLSWLSLEINMMSVVPLLATSASRGAEVVVKYFLVQAWGSLILIWGLMGEGSLGLSGALGLASLALFLKLGVVPFHAWFVGLLKLVDWKIFVLLSTVQKVLPLILLESVKHAGVVELGVIGGCLVVGLVGSLKEVKSVMALSSVFSLSWLLSSQLGEASLWEAYLVVYTLGLLLFSGSVESNLDSLSFSVVKESGGVNKISCLLALVVLSGLPPFVGFAAKVLVLMATLSLGKVALAGLLVFGAAWMMLAYVRMGYLLVTQSPSSGVLAGGLSARSLGLSLSGLMASLPLVLWLLLCIGVSPMKFWVLSNRSDLMYMSSRTEAAWSSP